MNRQDRIRRFKREYKEMIKNQNFMLSLPLTRDEKEFLPEVYAEDRRDIIQEFQNEVKMDDKELMELLISIK